MILSIITVNFNNAFGLRKTIQSVIGQIFKNFEFIVIDGASNDNSKEIIESFADKINYWVSEPDNGIYHAMNKGILQAKGKYCLFLNSGDVLANPNVLSSIFYNKGYNNISFIRGNQITDFNTRTEKWNNFGNREVSIYDLYISSFHHQATFIRRDLFDKYGLYNENFKIVSDWEFTIKALLGDEKSIYINEDIVIYEYGGTSSDPNNQELKNKERRLVIDNFIPKSIQTDYDKIIDLKHKEAELLGYRPLIDTYWNYKIFRFLFRAINKMCYFRKKNY